MAPSTSLKGFAVIVLVMEVFFAIIYAFEEGYSSTVTFEDYNGLLTALFLSMLLLIGTQSPTQDSAYSLSTSRNSA
jgi:hypothetical protein